MNLNLPVNGLTLSCFVTNATMLHDVLVYLMDHGVQGIELTKFHLKIFRDPRRNWNSPQAVLNQIRKPQLDGRVIALIHMLFERGHAVPLPDMMRRCCAPRTS